MGKYSKKFVIEAFNRYMLGEDFDISDDYYDDENDTVSGREYGKPRSFHNVNHVQLYLRNCPHLPDPNIVSIVSAKTLPYAPICQELLNEGWEIKWQSSSYRVREMERPSTVVMTNPKYMGYMMDLCLDWSLPSSKRKKNYKKIEVYPVPNTMEPHADYAMTEGDVVQIDSIDIFCPSRGSKLWNEEAIKTLNAILEKHEIESKKDEDAEVSIIVVKNGSYDIRSFSLSEANTSFEFPDLHYGEGFESFHENLLERIDEESKGLVLFHGEPGTGKTQYIRHLLKELCGANKAVLYSPPSVSASLAEPQMINFISDWIMSEQRDCILLIEDAEPLLESRSGGAADGRSTGISNLLNITDGILNDILGLMVIATFNIDIGKIDAALLRPGRLIARKEFKKMSELQTENLAATLGLEKPDIDLNKYPITLAEFYNNRKEKKILTHKYSEENRSRIGFIR